ncbi:hypothetical protein GCM10009733_091070 [Nonomuraea maheshkhaliensis]|uniref:DUF1906 domain-containing protein n=1 Tax=Nonomuraea maheshkhaliensis TaxID=419590 RepID=A0ABN2H0T9_9ACTN
MPTLTLENDVRQFLGSITRRERRFAAAGTLITLLVLVPVVAVADPGLVPGTPAQSATEQAVDAARGDSCRDTLPADTPDYVVCRWLTPPQDAAAVAAFWGADGGANLEQAQPLPAQYVRCNRKTDLSTSTTCKGGTTFCRQLPSGWYQCTDETNGKVTYERYVNGKKQVQSTPPPSPSTTTSSTTWPTSSPTPSSPDTASTPLPTPTPPDETLPPDGNPPDAGTPTTDPTTPSASVPTVTAEPTASTTPTTPEPGNGAADGDFIATAKKARLRIWLESDLADDYLAGDTAFTAALQQLVTDAKRTDVTGVKFADNLAYTGFSTEQQVIRFLNRATQALRAALPGKRLAIGVVVPELGCGDSQPCITGLRKRAPLVTKQHVNRYLRAGDVDRVEIAGGLFGRTYRQYQVTDPKTGKPTSITPALATRAQWMSVKALEWDTLAQIGVREYGLAHTGDTSPWTMAQATAQIEARIGTAIGLGASTITLWGHKATADGQTYRLLNAGLADNPTWNGLTGQGLRGRLAVVIDPTSTERGAADIVHYAKGVSEIFILI